MILYLKPQKHFLKITMLLWFLFFSQIGFGQNMTQTVRGYVYDSYNHNPLDGASVAIVDSEIGTTTNINGSYRLENVPVGRYSLQVSFVGYEILVIAEILLESGKELVLDISLKESSSSLKEVVVKSTAPNSRNKILPSAEILTIEETLRLPATFYDPARLAFSYAGVATNNDQANHMIIRGNSPNNMSWRLEGVEIVNPNHTSNAGTASDRPSRNGGGVNMLSAQLLGNSTFMRGAFPAQYGNALSGIMDMNFRKGNNETHEFTGQIGVIGIDLAAEGPLSKNKKASYLINYRYSTLGLLGAAGVDLGDEAINYQDLAFTTFFPLKKGGEIKLFGLFGNSSNEFEAKVDSLVEVEKDQKNIDFKSSLSLFGLKFSKNLNNKLTINSIGIASSRTNNYNVENELDGFVSKLFSEETMESRFSNKTYLQIRSNSNFNFEIGIDFILFDLQKKINRGLTSSFLRPYFEIFGTKENIDWSAGVSYNYFFHNKKNGYEPRGNVKWNFSEKQSLNFAYALNSQVQDLQIYLSLPPNTLSTSFYPNQQLDFSKSNYFSIRYESKLNSKTILNAEIYYQSLFDIPVSKDTIDSYSILNLFNEWNDRALVNEGTGENYGIELSAQQYFSNNTFWLANVSLYESKYKGSDGIERDTRFNGNYIVNATYGKEFPYSKKGKDYILGVNVRLNLTGGMRETPIANGLSKNEGKTVYIEEDAYSLKAKDSFKTDLRIYWKRNKKKFNSTLALDIQNVTNRKNPSFRYYDTYLDGIVQNYQLGLIPILSYRIEF